MSHEKDIKHTTMDVCIEESSDAESFHSAVSRATRLRARCRASSHPLQKTAKQYLTEHRPGTADKSPRATSPTWRVSETSSSRPSSWRHRRSSVAVPGRKSSLPTRKKPLRTDSVTLHRQSCQLFSSLDGMLTSSRETTPLTSGFSSRTATRCASIAAQDSSDTDLEAVPGICEQIDAKLAHASYLDTTPASYPYSLTTHSASFIPYRASARLSSDGGGSDPVARLSARGSISSGAPPFRPTFNTVTSWTSDATRQREYEKIDRAHRGLRGFLRRSLPQCMHSKRARRGFFTGDCEGDSVRRFRLDMAGDECDDTDVEEHDDDDEDGEETAATAAPAVDDEKKRELDLEGKRVEHVDSTLTTRTKPELYQKPVRMIPDRKTRWTCFQ